MEQPRTQGHLRTVGNKMAAGQMALVSDVLLLTLIGRFNSGCGWLNKFIVLLDVATCSTRRVNMSCDGQVYNYIQHLACTI